MSGACRGRAPHPAAERLRLKQDDTMATKTNKQWLLASRPAGEATVGNFRSVETPVPALAEGQVLVRHHYLARPLRMRMNDARATRAPQALNAVMGGGTVGEVVA